MEKKNVKVLAGSAIVLGALFVCGLASDAYEKRQWMKRYAQEEKAKEEAVSTWSGQGTPHLQAMKDTLDKAEKILSEDGDLKEVRRLLSQCYQNNVKALSNGEPEGVREALLRRYYKLDEMWTEKGCLDMQRHPENWSPKNGSSKQCRQISPDTKEQARMAARVKMMFNPVIQQLEAESIGREIASNRKKFACEQKMRGILDECHDYEMARASDMTVPQYRTHMKNPDLTQISPRNPYLGGRQGDSSLVRDAAGNIHEIDSHGNKWWRNNGCRIAEH